MDSSSLMFSKSQEFLARNVPILKSHKNSIIVLELVLDQLRSLAISPVPTMGYAAKQVQSKAVQRSLPHR